MLEYIINLDVTKYTQSVCLSLRFLSEITSTGFLLVFLVLVWVVSIINTISGYISGLPDWFHRLRTIYHHHQHHQGISSAPITSRTLVHYSVTVFGLKTKRWKMLC